MRLIVDHSALRTALQLCATCVKKRQVIPILAHVLLRAIGDELMIAATDLETTVLTSVDAAVREEGACTVELSALMDVVKNATEDLSMHAHGGNLDIVSGDSSFQLLTLAAGDFPTLPEMNDTDAVVLSASTLLPMIRTCSYPMTSEETRAQLNGELFSFRKSSLTIVAADAHRMAVCETPFRSGREVDIFAPASLIDASGRLGVSPDGFDVTVSWNDSHVGLRLGRDLLIGRRPEVNFPQWRKAVPENITRRVVLDTTRLVGAVRAVTPFSASKAVRWAMDKGTLALSAQSSERGSSRTEIAIDYSGDRIEFGYEGRLLSEALATVATERVSVSLNDHGAMIIEPHESGAPYSSLHVVMNRRVQ